MKQKIFAIAAFASLLPIVPGTAFGQTPEDEVLAVVQRLFDGMRAADSTAVRSVFHESSQLFATGERDGTLSINVIPADRFVAAVGGATGQWDERIWDTQVRIDDNLASVWTQYAFYLNGEFSHCGVDAFTLAKTTEGWKIVSLADTRRQEGCRESEAGGQ